MTVSHVKIGFITLCLAILLGAVVSMRSGSTAILLHETNIAVEHVAPATLTIDRLAGSGTNIIEVSMTGTGMLALHVPSSWRRQELRDAPINQMIGEPQDWGYIRWTMPSGATARFLLTDPGTITVHNPSNLPLTVSTVTIRNGSRTEDAFIVTDESYVLP